MPNLFIKNFSNETWRLWQTVLKAAFGGKLDEAESQAMRAITGRETLPQHLRELWMIVGRRGGKDAIAAFVALWLACSRNWHREFKAGELITGMIVCPDRRQGRVALNYMQTYCEQIPQFGRLVTDVLKESIKFSNGISIEIHTASFRSVRGYTIPFVILDEIAFFQCEDAANPDSEIIAAIRPAMATVKNPLLIAISSPYARRGELYRMYRTYYGQKDENILVLKGPTQAFNPTIPAQIIQDAFEQDPISAASEYGNIEDGITFRADVEGFIMREAVEACVIPGRLELLYDKKYKYEAFCDPSGGLADSMTIAIAHEEADHKVLDCMRERIPPFSPEAVVADFSTLLRNYNLTEVTGDKYAGEWPRERFRMHGIEYRTSDKAKSDIYRELLPALNSDKIELLDNPRLITQLCNLERRTSRGGRDSIDHPPGAHDDLINAAAGVILNLAARRGPRAGDQWGWYA